MQDILVSNNYMVPKELAARWHWHEESIRRLLRERRIASIVIGRRRLIPVSEIIRVERNGLIDSNISVSH
jgi:hypothetical protein